MGVLEIGAVLGIEFLEVGMNTLSKAAVEEGMNNFVFLAYSTILGVLFLIPLTFIYYRMTSPPPQMTTSIFCKICLVGLIGYCLQICIFKGIAYSTPTMASALGNLTPAFTFILARIARMERIDLKSITTQAKIIGTVVSIGGAFTVTFYQGPAIFSMATSSSSLNDVLTQPSLESTWVLGGFLVAAGSFSLACLLIVETWIIRDYNSVVMVTLISMVFSGILAIIIALILVRDLNAWKLGPDLELVSIFYMAILMVIVRNIVLTWVLRKKGPVFLTIFKPLAIVIALVMGIFLLGETLYLGSVIGSVIIAIGFYSVLWGKAEEEKAVEDTTLTHSSDSNSEEAPLLQKESMES